MLFVSRNKRDTFSGVENLMGYFQKLSLYLTNINYSSKNFFCVFSLWNSCFALSSIFYGILQIFCISLIIDKLTRFFSHKFITSLYLWYIVGNVLWDFQSSFKIVFWISAQQLCHRYLNIPDITMVSRHSFEFMKNRRRYGSERIFLYADTGISFNIHLSGNRIEGCFILQSNVTREKQFR